MIMTSKIKEKRNMVRRAVGIFLSAAMVLHMLPPGGLFVYASEEKEGLCTHHTEHTAECGYREAGVCTHEHTSECYQIVTNCVHTHTEECFPECSVELESAVGGGEASEDAEQEKTSGDEAEPENCTHICGEESGCVTKELDCRHEHRADDSEAGSISGENCGYAEAQPCTYDCPICAIEDLIDALPGEVAEENAEEVRGQLEEILELFAKLDDEEQEQIDLSACYELWEKLDAANAPTVCSSNATNDLDFSSNSTDSGTLESDGYHWNAADNTLELENVAISGTVTLPDATITIKAAGDCSVDTLTIGGGNPQKTHLIFSGPGQLTIQNQINISGGDGLDLTVASGARVTANGGLSIGASGGASSTVTVNGTLTAKGTESDCAVYAGKVVVGNGGLLKVSGKNGIMLNGMNNSGSKNFTGVFTVEQGGCLDANCESFNIQVYSGGSSFPAGSGEDQAFNIPDNYLPTDCEPRQKDTGKIDLVRKSTGEVYTGPLMIHENHSWPDTFNGKDESGHWKICMFEGCDKTKDYEAHRYDDNTGRCVCGSTLEVTLNGAVGLIYNGQEQKPGAAVTLDGTLLDASRYNITYRDNLNAGEASVIVAGKDGLAFARTVKFRIARATPEITWGSTAQTAIYSGSQARIVPPAVTLVNGERFGGELVYSYAAGGSSDYTSGLPVNAGTYTIRADVPEGGNYNAAGSTNTLTLTVEKAENAPNMPSDTMNVDQKHKKVNDVKLPAGWQWQETDQNTALKTGAPVTATAVYVGADKDNYKNVTRIVAITRMKGSAGGSSNSGSSSGSGGSSTGHDSQDIGGEAAAAAPQKQPIAPSGKGSGTKAGTVPGQPEEEHIHDYNAEVEKEASCTEAGVKKYVCSCGDRYTESIPALNHSYQEEITEEPTVSTEGVKTYTCSRCGDTYTEPIDRLEDISPEEPENLPEKSTKTWPWWIILVVVLVFAMAVGWYYMTKKKEEIKKE